MPGGKGKINEYNKSLTAEERKKSASKAGKKSGEKRKLNADIRSIAKEINNAPAGEDLKAALGMLNVEGEHFSNAAGIAMAVFQAAINGDMKAVAKWEQYVGQAESAQSGENGMLADLIDRLKDEE